MSPSLLRSVHLDYALYELLKNAMRAVVEHSWSAASMPAVNVHIAGSSEQITLRISDQASPRGCFMLVSTICFRQSGF